MIYTPRVSIDMLTHPATAGLKNKQVCTKIDFKGFEISIAMDSSHGPGDLFRSDIRVFDNNKGKEISDLFYVGDETMLYGDADTLLRVMKQIETMHQR
jgi:hypothetical protein